MSQVDCTLIARKLQSVLAMEVQVVKGDQMSDRCKYLERVNSRQVWKSWKSELQAGLKCWCDAKAIWIVRGEG